MNDDFLKSRLNRVARRYLWLRYWRKLAACWAGAALLVIVAAWLQRALGWQAPWLMPALAGLAGACATAITVAHFGRRTDLRWVARRVEARHPELNGVLLTAVQQRESGQPPGYLEYRVLEEATKRSQEHDWRHVVPSARLFAIQVVHLVALGCLLAALAGMRTSRIHGEEPRWIGADGIAVTPGDASLERGDSLVVLARFDGTVPPSVNLVIRQSGAEPRSTPLVKSLADPVFGGSVPEVAADFTYQLEYRGKRTREFKVSVFEHPRLLRADVALTFPTYTQLPPKQIEDTRRVSAVEGTRLDYALQLNKPVKSARLVARDPAKTVIPLAVTPDKAVATLANFIPEKTLTYDLQLIDGDGRANKVAAPFVIDVQPNRRPELRIVSPRGDVRPSALEEVAFEATVWDDFGAPAYGLAYSISGGETRSVELGRGLAAKERKTVSHLLKLEELGVKPDDLISWHTWADDVGPDGKVRRTTSDLFFGEVRPFDEIFRESQNMESPEQQAGQGQGGNARRRLTDLQKQIINATWKLHRDGATPKYRDDAKVLVDSQQQALEMAAAQMAESQAPTQQALWQEATRNMEKAVKELESAARDPAKLAAAMPPEHAAYQALLKLQARETSVTRSRRGGGGGGGQEASRRQMDQLDLKQAENRYETQRQARAPQNQERREQLAVMNRLQELARRQQDLNERLKELQTALQEARSEEQREEIRRRLKRLQEEQQQMLADVDEVRQRMDRPENQSRMSEERRRLEQTREDVQRAAEATAEGSVAQAVASGTRAQRQLQELRDEMRKENASRFAEDLREMRQEARDLSRDQEELGQKLDELARTRTQRRSLSDAGDSKELLDALTQQKERMNRLVERATQVSEQAENSEPLLSRQLYDSLRRQSQADSNSVRQARDDLLASGALTFDLRDRLEKAAEQEGNAKALEVTSEMLREGAIPQASRAGQRARAEIDDLRRGVERAAESVLGDDAEQLRLAQSELDALTDQLQREMSQANAGTAGDAQRNNPRSSRPGEDSRQAGAPSGTAEDADNSGRQPNASNPAAEPPGTESGSQAREGQRGSRRQVARNERQPGQPGEPNAGSEAQSQAPAEPSADGQPGGNSPGNESAGTTPSGAGQAGARPGQAQQDGRIAGQSQGEGAQAGAGRGGVGNEGEGQRSDRPGGRDAGRGGERRRSVSLDDLMQGGGGAGWNRGGLENGPVNVGPLTSEDFGRWSERLRDVEELLDSPDLRNAVAGARERARLLRRDVRENLKKPDWTVVNLEVLKPLVEVRQRVVEELSRRTDRESLAPIDRDPVPARYAESVRRYYEELGKDQPQKQ